jgi:hypothetical protein
LRGVSDAHGTPIVGNTDKPWFSFQRPFPDRCPS